MKKKLLFILPSLRGGGAERVISILANNIDSDKFNCTLVLLKKEGKYLNDLKKHIRIIGLNVSRVRYSPFKIIRLIYKEKPDIVLSTLGHLNVMLSIVLPLMPKKTKFIARESNIVSMQTKNKFINILYKLFYNNFDTIVAQSNDMRDDLIKNYGVKPVRIKKINNPIDFKFIDQKLKEEKKVEMPKNMFNLLAVGRLSHQKGFDLLINVFAKIERDDIYLTILGQGEEKAKLEKFTKKLGVSDKVSFLGFKENPYLYMREADLFVLSSRYEGFPNVVLEANACGTPVLANKCKGGINEIVIEGRNGFAINYENPSEFINGINKIRRSNLNSEKIQQLTKDRYNVNKIVKKYEKLFGCNN